MGKRRPRHAVVVRSLMALVPTWLIGSLATSVIIGRVAAYPFIQLGAPLAVVCAFHSWASRDRPQKRVYEATGGPSSIDVDAVLAVVRAGGMPAADLRSTRWPTPAAKPSGGTRCGRSRSSGNRSSLLPC